MIGGQLYGDRTVLIKGGYVLTLDPSLGDMPHADVLIDGDKIAAVQVGLTAGPHANVIDARDRIVMPGFVDTHRHTWQTPVRGVLPSCTLDEYFAGMLNNIGIQYRAEDVYIANLMGALEALNAGITTLLDGARACALDHKVGTITPGKQADIILVRTDQVNVAPVIDPVATVVICADTSNIDTVFVAGRIVKQNGRLIRVEMARLLQRLSNARDHLLSKAGVIPQWVLSRLD